MSKKEKRLSQAYQRWGGIPLPEPLLTLPQTCEYLQISKETMYRMIYKKKIPFTKVGKLYRFRVSEVAASLLAQGKKK